MQQLAHTICSHAWCASITVETESQVAELAGFHYRVLWVLFAFDSVLVLLYIYIIRHEMLLMSIALKIIIVCLKQANFKVYIKERLQRFL